MQEIRYFSSCVFNFEQKTWHLYGEKKENELKGVWQKQHHLTPNGIRFSYTYHPDEIQSIYKITFNRNKKIIEINHTKYQGSAKLFYVDENLSHIQNDLSILSNLSPNIYFHYLTNETKSELKNKVHWLVMRDEYDHLLYTKHYSYYRGDGFDETKIITIFPKGRIKSIEIYNHSDFGKRYKRKYKRKIFSEKNAYFTADSSDPFPKMLEIKFAKDFYFLSDSRYMNMEEYDEHIIRYGKLSLPYWQEYRFRPGDFPSLVYLSNNVVTRKVVIKESQDDVLNETNTVETMNYIKKHLDDYFSWEGLDNKKWRDYTLWLPDFIDGRYQSTYIYKDGLLIELKEIFETLRESIELGKTTFRYFPNRQLFNVSHYQEGKLINEQQKHYTPTPSTP